MRAQQSQVCLHSSITKHNSPNAGLHRQRKHIQRTQREQRLQSYCPRKGCRVKGTCLGTNCRGRREQTSKKGSILSGKRGGETHLECQPAWPSKGNVTVSIRLCLSPCPQKYSAGRAWKTAGAVPGAIPFYPTYQEILAHNFT